MLNARASMQLGLMVFVLLMLGCTPFEKSTKGQDDFPGRSDCTKAETVGIFRIDPQSLERGARIEGFDQCKVSEPVELCILANHSEQCVLRLIKAHQVIAVDVSALGEIPASIVQSLSECRSLRKVTCAGDKNGPTFWDHLLERNELEYLFVRGRGAWRPIKMLSANLRQLTQLRVEGCLIGSETLGFAYGQRSLKALTIRKTAFESGVIAPLICRMATLVHVDLSGSRWVNDSICSVLLSANELINFLDLSYTGVTNAVFMRFALNSLTRLRLAGCAGIDGTFMRFIPSSIRELDISSCANMGGELASLGKCVDMEVLKMAGADNILAHELDVIARFAKIRVLVLDEVDAVGDHFISCLAASRTIQHVSIRGTNVSNRGLSSLMGLQSLQSLDISGCLAINESAVRDFVRQRPEVEIYR